MKWGQNWQTAFNLLSKREKVVFLVLFATAWVTGTLILINIDRYHSKKVPASGGTLVEGEVLAPKFINPLLTVSDTDRDLTRIIYAGLLKSDGKGGLTPNLAERYEISEDGLTYTFYLKNDLYWHDNSRLTAQDVAFTINLAKNPKIDSPKRANWEGVAVEISGDREVKFHLKKPYAPFLENATLGIMPKHIWEKVAPEEFHLSEYNIQPIGAGPFRIGTVTKTQTGSISRYRLERFSRYRPRPAYLNAIEFVFFSSKEELATAMKDGDVNSGSGSADTLPKNSHIIEIRLPRIFGLFFNQGNFKPLEDLTLRTALELAIDRERIIREVAGGYGTATSLPIPPGTFGHASTLEATTRDREQAKNILAKAGYADTDGDGIIEKKEKKNNTPIVITIATSDDPGLKRTAELIRDMWREIGVGVNIQPYELGDLEQTIIRPRNFETLLFGQVVGYDPDPFAFWHSSQRNDPRLNIALYASTRVDKLLDDARSTTDADKREELYKFFQQEIVKDKPAIFLYSPSYLYTIPGNLHGVALSQISLPQERFSNIAEWYMSEKSVWNILLR